MREPESVAAPSARHEDRKSLARHIRDTLSAAYSRGVTRLATPVTRDITKRTHLQHRQSDASTTESYHQLASLMGLYATLGIRTPLPRMRGYAISPDFACELVRVIHEIEPDLIVELGSGVSTVISAYALMNNGHGRVISLEHDADWSASSRALITEHGLGSVAEVIHAPLTPLDLCDKRWLWYDTQVIEPLDSIDLLVVDGPPAHIQSLARYPALPVMHERLRPAGVILLDDTDREDEQEILRLWDQAFKSFSFENRRTEKGAVLMRQKDSAHTMGE